VFFLAILGFIGAGFMILAGVIVGLAALAGAGGGIGEAMVLVIYIPLGLLYIIPSVYLYRYSARIRDFVLFRRTDQLEQAIEAQKSFWRFVGILMAVILGIYAVVLVGMLLFMAVGLTRLMG
jgi:hypothetical protein